MSNDTLYKIKDSVDLFLSNEKYLMVYYMNSRQRKSFRINEEVIHLIECLDGRNTVGDLLRIMQEMWNVSSKYTLQVLDLLKKNRIITEVVQEQSTLFDEYAHRYDRQINYFSEFLGSEMEGICAQRKLIDSKVLILGCGAIGGNIALQLAMAGVEHFVLFDHDAVETSDAARHMFYQENLLGYKKVDALKKEILKINSTAQVGVVCEVMNPQSEMEELISKMDFVVNTMDEPYIGYTSAKISRICIKHNIAHFIGGGFDAHLASTGEIIIPYITPCVECYAGHFKESLKGWKPRKHPVKERYTEIGGLASMSLFSSSYACIEIIKYLAGIVSMQDSYKVRGEFLFNDMSLTYLNVEKNPDCPVCGGALKDET